MLNKKIEFQYEEDSENRFYTLLTVCCCYNIVKNYQRTLIEALLWVKIIKTSILKHKFQITCMFLSCTCVYLKFLGTLRRCINRKNILMEILYKSANIVLKINTCKMKYLRMYGLQCLCVCS